MALELLKSKTKDMTGFCRTVIDQIICHSQKSDGKMPR
jgi:hypothetical protein